MRNTDAVTLLSLAACLCVAAASAQETKPAQEPKATPAEAATYLGSEVCHACHEDIFNGLRQNAHYVIETKGLKERWKGQACESCHGPGSKHAESASPADIVNPGKLAGVRADQACFTCHRDRGQTGRVFGSHARGQVTCAGCHPVHRESSFGMVARTHPQVNAQCSICHTGAWSEFRKPHAHRLPQHAMSCTDCHNPHGTTQPQLVRTFAGNEPGCFVCHADKRGPFTFEHAPMRFEGCRTCHEPHGSQNPRMLIRAEVRQVCLECHANLGVSREGSSPIGNVPPAFHDLRSPRFQNCTICHQKIHGSHVDRNFLR